MRPLDILCEALAMGIYLFIVIPVLAGVLVYCLLFASRERRAPSKPTLVFNSKAQRLEAYP